MRFPKSLTLKFLVVSATIFGFTMPVVRADDFNPSMMNTNDKEEFVIKTINECNTMVQNKKYVEARKRLQQAASLDPTVNSAMIHCMLGFVDQNLGDLEGAVKENELAMNLDPSQVQQLAWNTSIAYKDLGNFDMAREWARRYLDTNPTDANLVREAQGLIKKLGEQAGTNAAQNIHSPDYLDALVMQNGAGRWPRSSFPLKVFIEKSDGVPGVPENSTAMLGNAFDSWNKASGGSLPSMLVPNRKQADVTIQWTNRPDRVSSHDGVHVEQGVTKVMRANTPGSQIGTIRSADITLLTISRETGETIPPDEMKGVCLHEIGHALGLGGHSANSADTMYFSTSVKQLPALSHRDKFTIARLYSVSPGGAAQSQFGMNGNMPPFSPPFSNNMPNGYPRQNMPPPMHQPYPQQVGQYSAPPQGNNYAAYPQGASY